jgi:hypothetical protein
LSASGDAPFKDQHDPNGGQFMRKKLAALFVGCIFAAMILAAEAVQAKSSVSDSDFSGTWVLETSQTRNVPDGLESYTMTVAQNGQQLKVATALLGDLRPAPRTQDAGGYPGGGNPNGGGYPGGGYPGGGYPGGGYPGGVGMGRGGMGGMGGMGRGGMGRGGMGRGGPGGMPSQRVEYMAYKYYPATVEYPLDGSQGSTQLGDPEQTPAASQAQWSGGGKELKLSLNAKDDTGDKANDITVKDQWKLDGRYLKVARTVKTAHGSETVHLVFRKQIAGDTAAPAQ